MSPLKCTPLFAEIQGLWDFPSMGENQARRGGGMCAERGRRISTEEFFLSSIPIEFFFRTYDWISTEEIFLCSDSLFSLY